MYTPAAFNNLVYGQGYRPEGASTEEAYLRLLDETSGDEPPPMADTTEQP